MVGSRRQLSLILHNLTKYISYNDAKIVIKVNSRLVDETRLL